MVSSSAVSAPLQYGPEVSADQKRWVSKLASTSLKGPLTDVAGRDLVLPSESSERAVRLELCDARLDLGADWIALAVVDPEGVLLRERVRDGDLAWMSLGLEGEGRVLGEVGVGAADDHLRNRVVVARVALQAETELRLHGVQVLLVLRPRLHDDAQALHARVRAGDVLRVAGFDDEHSMRLHVADGAGLLQTIGCDEDPADHRIALLRVQRRDQAWERSLQRLRALAERMRERGRHVDVEPADGAAGRGELHGWERRIGAERERCGTTCSARSTRHGDCGCSGEDRRDCRPHAPL